MNKAELLRIVNSLPNTDADIKIVFNTRCYKDTVNYLDVLVTADNFVKISPIGSYIGTTLSRNTRLLFNAELPFRI